ncbi:crossover junction endonuclease MUS81 isoform X4 [Lepisosteus oculatus]|uniref:crossover junction endonuclease MUS81 isoform X4 n=1 Tax=Lepisosteus oculatus TaxID=7918 RepID=UPI0003EAE054|nr:PREDICTED: crossover junction endonuclease MUS81 isoform X4 [Lepisosteus oculatus]
MASGQVQFGRKRAVPGCPNPLFLRWLTELRDSAAEKGQRTQFTYQKAIGSLRKYPLPLRNGREAKILQHFGDGICRILDERLEQYYSEHGPDAPIHSLPEDDAPPPRRNRSAEPPPERPQASPRKRRQPAGGGGRRAREYVPQKGSGGYAVLVALYRHSQAAGSCGFLLKSELQREAQPLCDKSFTLPEPGSKYTAWSSVSTLIQKDLLLKTHSPARYSLTEKGRELAERLEKRGSPLKDGAQGSQTVDLTEEEEEEGEEEPQPGETRTECSEEEPAVALPARTGAEDPGLSGAGNSQASGSSKASWGGSSDPTPEVTLLPGTFEILLCVDFIETTGGSSARKQELVLELRRNGVQFDVRKLHVGDFLWVARQRVDFVPGQLRAPPARELVLDYIVERKRMDDLCGSIIDGRFREQKFRLKRCGLRKPIYLVENYRSATHLSLPESTLSQAIVNTQVVDGFFVKRTQDVRESAAYLTVMTRFLQRIYANRTLQSRSGDEDWGVLPPQPPPSPTPPCSLLTFTDFNQGAVKNKAQTVKEVFARQLMQISGISGDKAAAVLEQYSTVSSLLQAYDSCTTEQERERLLSSVRYGKLHRNLGPVLSRTVCQLYCTPGPLP